MPRAYEFAFLIGSADNHGGEVHAAGNQTGHVADVAVIDAACFCVADRQGPVVVEGPLSGLGVVLLANLGILVVGCGVQIVIDSLSSTRAPPLVEVAPMVVVIILAV